MVNFKKKLFLFQSSLKTGTVVVRDDEYPRHGCTLENLKNLKPAFKKDGTVTAGNASGINDGAAAVVLMKLDKGRKIRNKTNSKNSIMGHCRSRSCSSWEVDQYLSSKKALDKAKWKPSDLDLIEANEAFAAQACAVNKEMGWDPEKVNVNGGSIAIGHPIGASGTRILTYSCCTKWKRENLKKGLATLCIGGRNGHSNVRGKNINLCQESH